MIGPQRGLMHRSALCDWVSNTAGQVADSRAGQLEDRTAAPERTESTTINYQAQARTSFYRPKLQLKEH